ncbi:MAG: serine/threonine protein kinase [Planctomycetes bacterium]|nr:serine/threonine protein kinase [Planctomycetota bacterium]
MAIASTGALCDVLRERGLLTPAQLSQLPHLVQGRSGDARPLAKTLVQRGWLTVYQINQLLADEGDDLVIGSYVVLDRLGQGGLSQVFKARHIEDEGWILALKVLRPAALACAQGREQFLHEMQAMARLDHPNIVQFCDLDQAGGTFYFTMEFIDGIDLGKHVDLSGPLPANQACDYIRQTALGLQHAYEKNLVHRDIKPANLFLTHVAANDRSRGKGAKTRAHIKILDWGLAGLRYPKGHSGAERQGPGGGGIIGTADYLAPEQARDHETVDIRGDIYSLGCTFHFLLTGRPPFDGGSLIEKLMQHKSARPAPITKVRPDVPEEVIAIVERMMAKDPAHRYQTPAALAAVLAPHAEHDVPAASSSRRALKPEKLPAVNEPTPLPGTLASHRISLARRLR